MLLSEAVETCNTVRTQEGFSPVTLKGYRLHYNGVIRDVGDVDIQDVTLQMLRDHLARYSHLKATSVAAKVRAIKSLFAWLVTEEYLTRSPTLKLREPKLPSRVPKALTMDEIEALREACNTPLEHALVEFFFATGCRVGEVTLIDINQIDWSRNSVIVHGKGNKEREVYFGAKARIWLKRYLSQRTDSDPALFVTLYKPHRMPIHRIWDRIKIVARRCGLGAKVSPHTFRHSLATTLVNQGAPITVVQSLLGHSKPETTMLYSHLSGTARQQSYNRYFVQ